jgi:hypothetical protein
MANEKIITALHALAENKHIDFKKTINEILIEKINDEIAANKQVIAQGMFAGNSSDEEVELDEAKKVTKKQLRDLEDRNEHGLVALKLAQSFGTPTEVKKIQDINKRHDMKGHIEYKDQKERDAIASKYWKMAEEVDLEEGFINLGGAKVKDDEKSILQHIKKTFPNVKKVKKDSQHGWIPVFEAKKHDNIYKKDFASNEESANLNELSAETLMSYMRGVDKEYKKTGKDNRIAGYRMATKKYDNIYKKEASNHGKR